MNMLGIYVNLTILCNRPFYALFDEKAENSPWIQVSINPFIILIWKELYTLEQLYTLLHGLHTPGGIRKPPKKTENFQPRG